MSFALEIPGSPVVQFWPFLFGLLQKINQHPKAYPWLPDYTEFLSLVNWFTCLSFFLPGGPPRLKQSSCLGV